MKTFANRIEQRASKRLRDARSTLEGRAVHATSVLPWLLVGALGFVLFLATPAQGQDRYASRSIDERTSEDKSTRQGPVDRQFIRLTALEQLPPQLRRTLSLRLNGTTLAEALGRISKQSGVNLIYGNYMTLYEKKVTLYLEKATIGEALSAVIQGTDLELMLSRSGRLMLVNPRDAKVPVHTTTPPTQPNLSRLVPAKIASWRPKVQTGAIAGIVTDSTTAEPLPGVNVVIAGTQRGASTDVEGHFVITDLDPSTYDLLASFVGYDTKRVEGVMVMPEDTTVVNIALSRTRLGLEEVVVVGYGTTQRRDLTGAVSSLDTEFLQEIPITNITEALYGKIPGVEVTTESGLPGGGITIRIRGGNSIQGNNNPLYVIDGFPISTGATGGGNFSRNPLSFLNPNDIESIQVLKDASATAIYGARGANGVVLITTKKGRMDQRAHIDYNGYYGRQSPLGRYEVLDARNFAVLHNEAIQHPYNQDPIDVVFSEGDIQTFGEGTDWVERALRSAPQTSHQLSVSGSRGNTRYYLSGNYVDQEGVMIGGSYQRVAFRTNLSTELSDHFLLGTSLTASQNDYTGSIGNGHVGSYGRNYMDLYSNPPIIPVRDEAGNYSHTNPVSVFPFDNPIEAAREIDRNQQERRLLANAFGEYNILPDLRLHVSLGVDVTQNSLFTYTPTHTAEGAGVGAARKRINSNLTWLNENTLTYEKTFGDGHGLKLLAGVTAQANKGEGTSAQSEGFANDILGYDALEGGTITMQVNSGATEWSLLSYLGRINYEYADRYLLTVTGRVDGSSRFGEGNKYGFFPSAAFAWRLSEEPFMSDVSLFDDLKLRVSYGITGSQAIPPYRSLAAYQSQVVIFGSMERQAAYFPQRLANPNLHWEQTAQFDVGVNMSLFDHRLEVTADYYNKKTTDLLLNVSLPNTSGYGSILQNLGSLQNKGFEMGVSSRNLVGDFTWGTDFNFSLNRQEVLNIGEVDTLFRAPTIPGALYGGQPNIGITTVGQPLSSFYTYVFDGIIQNEQELAEAPTYPEMTPGRERLKDLNGDGVITPEDDRTITGTAQPDFIASVTNRFTYKGFDLRVHIEGSYGNALFNASRFQLNRVDGGYNVSREYFENRWRGEGTSNEYPVPGPRPKITDRYVEDASFIRLKHLTLGYTLPEDLVRRINVRNLRVYATASNILTLTGYSGLDPDINVFGSANNYAQGIDYAAYPTARTVLFGVQLGL